MKTLAEALQETSGKKRYLLLGNGFSISLFPTCFSYYSLFEEAQNSGLLSQYPELEKAFDLLTTTDFELVMYALKNAQSLAPLYGGDVIKMGEHAEALKDLLVNSIAGKHPSRPNEITEEQYQNCRAFLAEFIGSDLQKKGKIFSLNYDLLLYWAVLHDIIGYQWDGEDMAEVPDQVLLHDDGFRSPELDPDANYVAWEQFDASHGQTISFLHGALHLYERGAELAKLCWERSGNQPLMDQIRASLDQNYFPIFVSEGDSDKKLARINKSAYLSKALRSFSKCCDFVSGNLFIIGHSLAANDDHILRRISHGKIRTAYISLFGDYYSDDNAAIRQRASMLSAARPMSHPLNIEYVDANSLQIWNQT